MGNEQKEGAGEWREEEGHSAGGGGGGGDISMYHLLEGVVNTSDAPPRSPLWSWCVHPHLLY